MLGIQYVQKNQEFREKTRCDINIYNKAAFYDNKKIHPLMTE